MDGTDSDQFELTAGVPQGSVVGPTLFSIYYADVPEDGDTEINVFADDTGVIASSVSLRLAFRYVQQHLNELSKYYTRWKIKVNASKTEAILFTRRRVPEQLPELSYDGSRIMVGQEIKYLGLRLSRRLNLSSHVTHVIENARAARKRMWKFVSPRYDLPVGNRLTVFILFLRSILTCNAAVWSFLCLSDQRKLESFQNQTLRLILGLRPDPTDHIQITNEALLEGVGLPRVHDFVLHLSTKLWNRLSEHENPLIRFLTNISHDPHALQRQRSPFCILEGLLYSTSR